MTRRPASTAAGPQSRSNQLGLVPTLLQPSEIMLHNVTQPSFQLFNYNTQILQRIQNLPRSLLSMLQTPITPAPSSVTRKQSKLTGHTITWMSFPGEAGRLRPGSEAELWTQRGAARAERSCDFTHRGGLTTCTYISHGPWPQLMS